MTPASGNTAAASTVESAPSAVPQAPPPADDGTGTLTLQPVQKIWSLFDVVANDGTIELRLGFDPGGGAIGRFRYAPVVNGAPELAEETNEIDHADTTGGIVEIAGKRPDLIFHVAAGFRAAASDHYYKLDDDNHFRMDGAYAFPGDGTGIGIQTWSNGRLLEWRQPSSDDPSFARLPMLGLLRGKGDAPSLSKALRTRLVKEAYFIQAYQAFPQSGEVAAIGRLAQAKGFGTVLWKDKMNEPTYAVTVPDFEITQDTDITLLGGNSMADARLLVGNQVMSWNGTTWVKESEVKDGLPDVWFGTTLVRSVKGGTFARFQKGGPWRKLKGDFDATAVDAAGVIWAVADGTLYSSKPPASPLPEVTEKDLVLQRKASVLRGGMRDVTGKEPTEYSSKCSMHYVLLDETKGTSDADDYAAVRKALAGHKDIGAPKFIVSRERGKQLFGALVTDDKAADRIEEIVRKAVKGSPANAMCAEPPAVREVKIDLATGNLMK
ncbi:MAG: hypothetical protein U0441_23605 [Polyangiaceae bacterium]